MDYDAIKAIHSTLPRFSPLLPVALLPYISLLLLSCTFALAFYFTTLPKNTFPFRETVVSSMASILGGVGVVALFCSVGVYV